MQSLDLTDISPVNTFRATPAADSRPDVIAASRRGRSLIKAGDPGHDIQALFDEQDQLTGALDQLGPRPTATGSLPSIPDPRLPFNGDSLAGVLRKHGLSQMDVENGAHRLRDLASILPAMRRQIGDASASTREAVHKACIAATKEILTTLEEWAPAIAASCKSDDRILSWETQHARLIGAKQRVQGRLKTISHERFEGYLVAVDNAETRARVARIESLAMAAAKGK